MSQFEKHINESEDFAFDFKNVIDSDVESLSNPTVKVRKRTEDSDGTAIWEDVTSEFGTLNASVSGTQVTFTLESAQNDPDQENSPYLVYCEVDVSSGRTLVATESLATIRVGDLT